MIKIVVEDQKGRLRDLEIPERIKNENLMEALKVFDYPMRATCGGMGLCADCHCQVISGAEFLPELQEQELATLDIQPDAGFDSRLACQIKVREVSDGLQIRLLGPAE